MEKVIEISVKDRIAWQTNRVEYICAKDFVVNFDFDSEWNEVANKTARFIHNGLALDVLFSGNKCNVPVIPDATRFEVGVYAGDLVTTTPATVYCKKSILSGGVPADPLPDVYAQLMEKLNSIVNNGGGNGGYPIKYVESLDENNFVNLRDLESDLYILYGYFKPFPGSDSTLIIDKGFYLVTRVNEGSHLLSISPLNFKMTCHEILVDGTNEKGFTYTNDRINLLDVNEAVKKIDALEIPVVPTVVSAFENDAGYLTEHQSLDGYAKTTDIPTDDHINQLINTALGVIENASY